MNVFVVSEFDLIVIGLLCVVGLGGDGLVGD